jgi:antitoxin (DNA-binding transcriptional repressor) of toxin-antitoxin stability system
MWSGRRIDLDQYIVHALAWKFRSATPRGSLQIWSVAPKAGDEVILTRHGQPAVRLVPVKRPVDQQTRRKLLEDFQVAAAGKITPGPSAARSQDFLYGEDGLPE